MIMKTTKFFGMMLFALALATTACTNVNDPVEDPIVNGALPFSETFEASLGKFTTQSVSGDQAWAFDSNKYALISGYLSADKSNHANIDWLISPEIDLSNVTTAKLTFDHAARYFTDLKTEATVWVSSNYIEGLPTTATWTQLSTKTFTDPGSWTLASSGEISLTAYAGKKIKIAFKYISTDTKAGTWEIKNFMIQQGEAVVDPADLVTGNGTEATPYNVAGGIANQGASKWVKGYIVGYVVFGTPTAYVFTSDTCTVSSNMLIAGSKTETDITRCMAVQLPSGAVQTGLNLKTVKTNLGKEVTIYGSLEAYFGKPGLKTVSYYALEGGTTGGTKPADTSNAIFAETFAASLGNFTQYSTLGDQVWGWSSNYKCALVSGYASSTRYVNEDWLISPAINLSTVTAATLTFSHAGNYFNGSESTNCTLFVSTNYNTGNPALATWTQLIIPTYDQSNKFTFTASGNISLTSYVGSSNVKIAFKYKSDGTATGTGNWEIKEVVVK